MAYALKPPTAIARADYNLVQQALLGSNYRVYANVTQIGELGKRTQVIGGGFETRAFNATALGSPWITAVVVGENGCHTTVSTVASVPVKIIDVPDYAVNTDTNFAVGTAGIGSIPASGWGARGDILYEWQLPGFDPNPSLQSPPATQAWFEVGSVTDRRIVMPARKSIAVASGMFGAQWTPPGRSTPGEITVSAINEGQLENLNKIISMPACLMLRLMANDVLEVCRIFIPSVTLGYDISAGDGESVSSGTAHGICQAVAIFHADGTPAS